MTTEQFPVLNRWTNEVQFTATIETNADALPSVKLGLAIRWGLANNAYLRDANLSDANLSDAYLSGANLRGANLSDANLSDAYLRDANLSDANLRGANLRGANLSGANLSGANLSDANLSGANLSDAYLRDANLSGANLSGANGLDDEALRPIIADYWMILSMARPEVPALITALREGRVNGSTYEGACACLVGTLENSGASGLPRVASSPAERWFAPIRKGDKPGDDGIAGFAATKALEWAERYCAATGIAIPAEA